ncbi:MAG: hypothetical protein R3F48_09230 [Candidatus Zixiibacteriota bacterium]
MNQQIRCTILLFIVFLTSTGFFGCGDDKPTPPIPTEPVLAVSVDIIAFGNTDLTRSFTISNAGTGELAWEIDIDSSWMTVDVDSGGVTTTPTTVTITLDRTAMKLGSSSGKITVSSNGGDDSITVSAGKIVTFGEEYFPMALGDTWYYTNDSGHTIKRTVEADSTLCTVTATKIYHNNEIAEAWSINDSGFFVHLLTGAISIEVIDPLEIPFNLPSTGTHNYSSGIWIRSGINCVYQDVDIEGTLTFINYESKTVPAGTFESVAELYYDPTGDDPEDPPYSEFYAPGIGLLDNGDMVLDSAFIGGVWYR